MPESVDCLAFCSEEQHQEFPLVILEHSTFLQERLRLAFLQVVPSRCIVKKKSYYSQVCLKSSWVRESALCCQVHLANAWLILWVSLS